MKTLLFLTLLLTGILSQVSGNEIPARPPFDENIIRDALREYQAALVVITLPEQKIYYYREALCREPLSPCSSFKIVNLCCAAENNIIGSADDRMPWDGKTRPIAAWNRDLTVKEAMAVSAVPHFQALAARIGPDRMQRFLDRVAYGNRDISGGITTFWLGSSLKISALQQADFLYRLQMKQLSFSPKTLNILKKAVYQTTGKRGTLYGKTGTMADSPTGAPSLGWYVGWIEHDGKPVCTFALNLRRGADPSGPNAKKIAIPLLEKLQLL